MADQKTRFRELTSMKYVDQAKWFLNGFWDQGLEKDSENVWKYTQKFVELDQKKKEGCELDEFWSHKFLESLGETLTVLQLREKLKKIDLDANGRMALLEYLAFKYNQTVAAVIDAPQGTNQKEIEEAQEKLQAVQDAYAEVQTQLDQQTRALEEQKVAEEAARKALDQQKKAEEAARKAEEIAKKAEDVATQALNDQKKAEDVVRKAENELKAAIDDLKSQEDAYQNQISSLEAKSKDTGASQVSRSKAANELSQLKQTDPLPLRKAKLTQEAALRKVEKERKAAEAATAVAEAKANEAASKASEAASKTREAEAATASAEQKTREAEEKTQALEEQKMRVEEAFVEAEARLAEAVALLEEVKKKGGVAHGAIWWMERELQEAKKYMPKRKQ